MTTGFEHFLRRKIAENGGHVRKTCKALHIDPASFYDYLKSADKVKVWTLRRMVKDHGMTPREVLETCGFEVKR